MPPDIEAFPRRRVRALQNVVQNLQQIAAVAVAAGHGPAQGSAYGARQADAFRTIGPASLQPVPNSPTERGKTRRSMPQDMNVLALLRARLPNPQIGEPTAARPYGVA